MTVWETGIDCVILVPRVRQRARLIAPVGGEYAPFHDGSITHAPRLDFTL